MLCYNWRFVNFWLEIWSHNWRFFIDIFDDKSDSITPQNFDTADIKRYTVYTCNNSKSEGSTFDGSSSVNISPMTKTKPNQTFGPELNEGIEQFLLLPNI
jgi:hypothetical protein